MVTLHAYKTELVVEDLMNKRKSTFQRPSSKSMEYPNYAAIIPNIKDGTPPSVTFDPNLLLQLSRAFPRDEQGTLVQSVSLWLLPEHAGVNPQAPAIMAKCDPDGSLAVFMGVKFSLKEAHWNTKLPTLVKSKAEAKAAAAKEKADKKAAAAKIVADKKAAAAKVKADAKAKAAQVKADAKAAKETAKKLKVSPRFARALNAAAEKDKAKPVASVVTMPPPAVAPVNGLDTTKLHVV